MIPGTPTVLHYTGDEVLGYCQNHSFSASFIYLVSRYRSDIHLEWKDRHWRATKLEFAVVLVVSLIIDIRIVTLKILLTTNPPSPSPPTLSVSEQHAIFWQLGACLTFNRELLWANTVELHCEEWGVRLQLLMTAVTVSLSPSNLVPRALVCGFLRNQLS